MDNDSASSGFSIWIDADACPREVRDLAWRNALGRRIRTVFVANSFLWLPDSEYLVFELVPPGADKADDHIVEKAGPLDLAVTGDIPLAARLVERGIMVLSPRGEEMTQANIGERLAMRNLMDSLRSAGMATGGPKELARSDIQRFANALDRIVTRRRMRTRERP